jgi:hypothetical protein
MSESIYLGSFKTLEQLKKKSVTPAVCMRTEMYQINKLSLSSEAVQFWYTTIKVHQQRYHGTVLTVKVHSDNQVLLQLQLDRKGIGFSGP